MRGAIITFMGASIAFCIIAVASAAIRHQRDGELRKFVPRRHGQSDGALIVACICLAAALVLVVLRGVR